MNHFAEPLNGTLHPIILLHSSCLAPWADVPCVPACPHATQIADILRPGEQ